MPHSIWRLHMWDARGRDKLLDVKLTAVWPEVRAPASHPTPGRLGSAGAPEIFAGFEVGWFGYAFQQYYSCKSRERMRNFFPQCLDVFHGFHLWSCISDGRLDCKTNRYFTNFSSMEAEVA